MPDNPFWDYSCDFYRRTGVAPACLALQDEGGADVNLVLYLLWCAATDRPLDAAAILDADAGIAPWRTAVVEPLRMVRRALKEEPLAKFGPDAYRDRIKATEIEAERLVQDALFRKAPLPGGLLDRVATARENLNLYAGHLGRSLPEGAREVLLAAFARA